MRHNRFLHILGFLNFSNSYDALDNNGPNYDRLGKLRHISDLLNDAHSKHYTSSENLTVDKVVFQWWEIFRQYIPKKHKCLGINIYKLYDMSGYTYDMNICLEKRTATHATVKLLTEKWKYMDISYMWTTSFRCQTYSIIRQNRKSPVEGQSYLTKRECHKM
jgi:hypothetical protein